MDWSDAWASDWNDDSGRIDIGSLMPVLRLARLGVLVEALQTEILGNYELTPREFDVLSALRRVGRPHALNPSQLYAPLRLSSGGTTKILKRLEASGAIEREPDPEDGRSVRVSLTSRGLALHDRVLRAIAAASTQVLSGLSTTERRSIDSALEKLMNTLEEA